LATPGGRLGAGVHVGIGVLVGVGVGVRVGMVPVGLGSMVGTG